MEAWLDRPPPQQPMGEDCQVLLNAAKGTTQNLEDERKKDQEVRLNAGLTGS